MKIFGYKDQGLLPEDIEPEELAEITLMANPEELRKIAAFISAAADRMETRGSEFSHEHLSDKQSGFEGAPHFVVFNPEASQ